MRRVRFRGGGLRGLRVCGGGLLPLGVVVFFYVVVVLFQSSNFNAPLFSFSKPFFFVKKRRTNFFLESKKEAKKKDLCPKYAQSIRV